MKKRLTLTKGMIQAIELMNCGYRMQRDPFTLKVELIKVREHKAVINSDFIKLWTRGYIVQNKPDSNLSRRTFSLTYDYKTDKELFICEECRDFSNRVVDYKAYPGGGGRVEYECKACGHNYSISF
jgi:Zn ribbon nucleic-acid-binding protein